MNLSTGAQTADTDERATARLRRVPTSAVLGPAHAHCRPPRPLGGRERWAGLRQERKVGSIAPLAPVYPPPHPCGRGACRSRIAPQSRFNAVCNLGGASTWALSRSTTWSLSTSRSNSRTDRSRGRCGARSRRCVVGAISPRCDERVRVIDRVGRIGQERTYSSPYQLSCGSTTVCSVSHGVRSQARDDQDHCALGYRRCQ